MKRGADFLKFLSLGVFALILVYFLTLFIPPVISQGINDLSSWYVYSTARKQAHRFKVVGIAIDEYSLNNIKQRWPWRRTLYADLLKILDREGVSTVGLDLVFVGESEDKQDDLLFSEVLKNISPRVILAYFFDLREGVPVFPLKILKDSAYSLGMIDTPVDADRKTRRLRGYVDLNNERYYSFSAQICAAYLNKKPQEIVKSLSLSSDKTFFLNYLLKPKDIVRVSFYDVLTNPEKLKKELGEGFLEGSLVLIYPETKISRDIHNTPLGLMPGGLLHLNGVVGILTNSFIRQRNILLVPFLIFSFFSILFVLSRQGFISGMLFTLGIIIIDFWGLVLFSLVGLKFDYFVAALFCLVFFALGSLQKYLSFLTQIIKIKDKATLDPLRNLFTLRYFYYRLGLEEKKIYLKSDIFLVFIYFELLKEVSEELATAELKNLWLGISAALSKKGRFWSVYSQDEVVGVMLHSLKTIEREARALKMSLESAFKKQGVAVQVKPVCVRFKKIYPLRELLSLLSSGLKNKEGRYKLLLKEEDLEKILGVSTAESSGSGQFLETLGEDIEDKNRQLMVLIENLNKEHAKTKEAFFQIISSLVNALEARDAYTEGHSERVSKYSLEMAEKLGWPSEEKEKLRKAALLHDLGKIGIPDSILHKRGQLNEEEYNLIKKHEVIGVKILEPLKDLSEILPWILYHHERWDGTGYPHGLSGEAIPAASQIISIADVYDALTTGRDYKAAFTKEDSIKEIVSKKGVFFNPRLVDLFIEILTKQSS